MCCVRGTLEGPQRARMATAQAIYDYFANPVDMVERIQLLMAEAVAARAKGE